MKNPGDTFFYEYVDKKTYLATIINTFTDEETGKNMCTISLMGTDKILVIENN